MSWSVDELTSLNGTEELQITIIRDDENQTPWTPIWVVTVGPEVFVRTWHRRETGWYGAALRSRRGRIRVPGVEVAVTLEEADERAAVDEAYRAKYARYGTATLDRMTSAEAAATTLRLVR